MSFSEPRIRKRSSEIIALSESNCRMSRKDSIIVSVAGVSIDVASALVTETMQPETQAQAQVYEKTINILY